MARSARPKVDPKLWFTMEPSCAGKHYLLSASHTFPGRFTVWCPLKKRAANCSLSDVKKASREASYWLKGFLAGNEPRPEREWTVESREFKAWEKKSRRFQKTGVWPDRGRPPRGGATP
jgi:hypothetical protein